MLEFQPTTQGGVVFFETSGRIKANGANIETLTYETRGQRQTLGQIADMFGIPVWLLAAANGLGPMPDYVPTTRQLKVPVRGTFRNPYTGEVERHIADGEMMHPNELPF